MNNSYYNSILKKIFILINLINIFKFKGKVKMHIKAVFNLCMLLLLKDKYLSICQFNYKKVMIFKKIIIIIILRILLLLILLITAQKLLKEIVMQKLLLKIFMSK